MFENVRICLNLVCKLAISLFNEVSSVCVTYVSFSTKSAVQGYSRRSLASMLGEGVG